MIQTNRKGVNYSDNMLDPYLSFDTTGTWSVTAGTGSGAHSTDYVFNGERALKLQNTAPTTDLTVTNSIQNTTINIKTGECYLSFYIRKENVSDAYTGNIKIFKNAVLLDTQTWSLADTENGEWYRFVSDIPYTLVEADVVTFTFTFDGDAGFVGAKTIYIDGMMLYNTERLDSGASPPLYQYPLTTYNLYTGWADYADGTYTTGSPFTVTDGAAAVDLPNDASTTVDSQKPIDIDNFYDGTVITGRNGDGINLTFEFKCRPAGVGADPRLTLSIDIGGAVGEIYVRDFFLNKGNGIEHNFLSSFNAYTLNTWEANGGTVKVTSTNEDIEIYNIRYVITRTHKAR